MINSEEIKETSYGGAIRCKCMICVWFINIDVWFMYSWSKKNKVFWLKKQFKGYNKNCLLFFPKLKNKLNISILRDFT